jgi:formylmethanofuran dehydrogenase subunit E
VTIGQYTFEEFCDVVERFHGAAAPGVVLGGFIVEAARAWLPEGTLFEALCETRVCLADAIQLLTPCTTGNGRLKVVHVGRFALTLYDKVTGEGVRAFLDVRKLDAWPEYRSWFLRLKPKAEQDSGRLLAEIRDAGPRVIGVERVNVAKTLLKKAKLGATRLCSGCGESFRPEVSLSSEEDRCGGCRGELPYAPSST